MDTPKINETDPFKKELFLERKDLPLTIIYKGKRYILILTKNDKLILNKYEE